VELKRRSTIRFILVAGAFTFCPSLFSRPLEDERQDFVIRSDVRLVLLDVSVKNRAGAPVSGLVREQFRVFENGKPQKITEFANNDVPVTVGLVVDESFSMKPKRAEVITAASTFITESNPKDEIFVLNFNDTVKRGLPPGELFSDDIAKLRFALFRGVPEGKTALHDAVLDGLQQLRQGRRDKKTLVVISDGGDNASRHTRRELIDAVQRSIATIYTIGLFTEDDPDRDPGLLARLAHISGGEAYLPRHLDEMVPVCRRIARDIRARYTVGYIPPASKGRGDLRHIRVEVSAPENGRLIAHTRTSYWYGEEPGTGSEDRRPGND
jgi:VWFA-related protein